MKTIALCSTISLLLLCGCGDKPAASSAPAEKKPAAAEPAPGNNPLTAPVDYLGTVAKAKKTADKTIETTSLNQAIQLFNAQEGRNPKDLNELVTMKYVPSLPAAPYGMEIKYDAGKGSVEVVPVAKK
jgi:hypothetical protein